MTHDPINSPSHYAEGRKYETIEVIEDWQLSYRLGNAVKYISRAGRKDPAKTVEDLKKAIWYINREIASLEGEELTKHDGITSPKFTKHDGITSPRWPVSPYAVTYEDVLEDYAACAVQGEELVAEYGVQDVDDQPLAHWDSDDDYMWDPTLGPVELSEEEIQEIRDNKDLDQFDDDEVICIKERRGLLIAVKRDGSTCLLNDRGVCQ